MLILVSNIIYILNNYTVSWFSLHATEVALVRGVMQVIVFGVVIMFGKRKQGKLDDTEGNNYIEMFPQNRVIHSFNGYISKYFKIFPRDITVRQWLQICLFGLLMSGAALTCLAAIPLMPIGRVETSHWSRPAQILCSDWLKLCQSPL